MCHVCAVTSLGAGGERVCSLQHSTYHNSAIAWTQRSRDVALPNMSLAAVSSQRDSLDRPAPRCLSHTPTSMEPAGNDDDGTFKTFWLCSICRRWLGRECFAEPPGAMRETCGTCVFGETWIGTGSPAAPQEVDEAIRAIAIGQGSANDAEEYPHETGESPTVSWLSSGSSSEGDPDDME